MTPQSEPDQPVGPASNIWLRILRDIVGLAVLGLCVATVMCWVGRFWWVADLFTHFTVYYLAASAVVLGVVLVMRRWRVAVVALVLVGVHGWAVWPVFNPLGAVVAAPGPRLVLAQVNLLHKNRDKQGVLSYIRGCDADVVMLQEVDPWWDRVFRSADLPYRLVVSHPIDHSFGIGLLVHDSADEGGGVRVEEAAIRLEADGFGRPTVEAVLEVGGRRIALLGIHPPPPMSSAYTELRNRILLQAKGWAQAQADPHIIIGDLNTTPWSHAFGILASDGGLRSSQLAQGNQGTWPTHLPMPWLLPIDHCLYSPDLACVAREVGPYIGSDHRPLRVTLAVSRKAPIPVSEPDPGPEESDGNSTVTEDIPAEPATIPR